MKNLIIISSLLLLGLNGFGQDIIIKSNGDSINCQITLVNDINIFYNIKKGKHRVENKFISNKKIRHYVRNGEKVNSDEVESEIILSEKHFEKDTIMRRILPYVFDSINYQFFYAIEIYRKEKFQDYSREGTFLKFSWNKKPIKGTWFFKNYPDTIIVKQEDRSPDLTICINDISSVAFKDEISNNHTLNAIGILGLMSKTPTLGLLLLTNSQSNWSSRYFLNKSIWKASIRIRKETKNDRKFRYKIKNELK